MSVHASHEALTLQLTHRSPSFILAHPACEVRVFKAACVSGKASSGFYSAAKTLDRDGYIVLTEHNPWTASVFQKIITTQTNSKALHYGSIKVVTPYASLCYSPTAHLECRTVSNSEEMENAAGKLAVAGQAAAPIHRTVRAKRQQSRT
jgi:quinolinate synthase